MKTRSMDIENDTGLMLIKKLVTEITENKDKNKKIYPVAFIDDASCDKHRFIETDHQESEKRTSVIRKAFQKFKLDDFMIRTGSLSLTTQDMYAVHNKEYVDFLIKCGKLNKPIKIEGSTDLSMTDIGSLESIFAASASVLGGVDTVCGKFIVDNKKKKYTSARIRKVFCNVRPPGHHAHTDHGAGFCFLNNVAMGASFAFDKYSSFIKKILIFDWDLHHGDGTENIFKDNPNVMYVSFHRGGDEIDGFYPYTGTTHMNTLKNIINFPIGHSESVESYMNKFHNKFLPLAYEFDPDLVFISAGFDSHKDDMYHALPLDYCHFQEMTQSLSKLADDCATGRLVSVLEGGYTPNILYRCAIIHMLTLVNGYDKNNNQNNNNQK